MLRLLPILIVAFSCLPGSLQASASSDRPEKELSAGVAVIVSPRPYPGADAEVIAVPAINARYKLLFFEGIRGGLELPLSERLFARAFGQMNFQSLDPADSTVLAGMAERRKSLDGGVELVYRGRPVGFRASWLQDLLSRNDGREFSAAATTGYPLGPVMLLAAAGPRWLSGNRANHLFGVRLDEALPHRPAYTLSGTWNFDLEVGGITRLGERWTLVTVLRRTAWGAEITGSPIVGGDSSLALVSFLTYRF